MIRNIGFRLIIAILLGFAALQIMFVYQVFNLEFSIIYKETIGLISYLFRNIIYLIVAVIVLIEISNLDKFHIDKYTLAVKYPIYIPMISRQT